MLRVVLPILMLFFSAPASLLATGFPPPTPKWSGRAIPPHRWQIVVDTCPDAIELLAKKGTNVSILKDPYQYVVSYAEMVFKYKGEHDAAAIERHGRRFRISKRVSKSEINLVESGLKEIPHTEYSFFRFYFDDGTTFETSDTLVRGDEKGLVLNPLELLSVDDKVRANIDEGRRLTTMEIVHPHLVEPLLIKNGRSEIDVTAVPDRADQSAADRLSAWLAGRAGIVDANGDVEYFPLDSLPAGVVSGKEVRGLRQLALWSPGGPINVWVTAIVGVEKKHLFKMTSESVLEFK